ncbi:MAG: hypothetical protein JO041_08905 [Acidobacteria bacterium]|nr:hypothetical protein [Acidobacteriota bacterium]
MKNPCAISICILAAMCGVAAAQDAKAQLVRDTAPSSSAQNVHQAPARDTYRLDYTITELEDGKKLNARAYTVMCEDEGGATRGELKVGSRVPVISSGKGSPVQEFTYLDIGINITAWLTVMSDGGLTLESHVEMSSMADAESVGQGIVPPPVIRQLKVSTNGGIAASKPVTIATADDVTSRRQFQIQVTATKLK